MQADFHLGIIYVLSRWAGFDEAESKIISLCSSFVDDNEEKKQINSEIRFDNNNLYVYKPIYSSRAKFDADNLYNPENASCWAAFHFLPGSNGADEYQKLVCWHDGEFLETLLEECVGKDLYRLGGTVHVLADAYAHEGFAGIKNSNNKITITSINPGNKFLEANIFAKIAQVLDPLGHAGAYTLPDIAHIAYTYVDHSGKQVVRDNPGIYLDASNRIFRFLQKYKGNAVQNDLTDEQKSILSEFFSQNLNNWADRLNNIHNYAFNNNLGQIPNDTLIAWRQEAEALAQVNDYNGFLHTNYFKFNEAVKAHKFFVLSTLNSKEIFVG